MLFQFTAGCVGTQHTLCIESIDVKAFASSHWGIVERDWRSVISHAETDLTQLVLEKLQQLLLPQVEAWMEILVTPQSISVWYFGEPCADPSGVARCISQCYPEVTCHISWYAPEVVVTSS